MKNPKIQKSGARIQKRKKARKPRAENPTFTFPHSIFQAQFPLPGHWGKKTPSEIKRVTKVEPDDPVIDIDTGHRMALQAKWSTKKGAQDAATFDHDGNTARLLGYVRLMARTASPEVLWERRIVHKQRLKIKGKTVQRFWDDDGEYATNFGTHIPVSHLMDKVYTEDVELIGDINGKEGFELLQNIHALQAPASSPWQRPLIRLLSKFCVHSSAPMKNGATSNKKRKKMTPSPKRTPETAPTPVSFDDFSDLKSPEVSSPVKTFKMRMPADKKLGMIIVDADDGVGVKVVNLSKKVTVAQRSGIHAGDVILSIGGKELKSISEAYACFDHAEPNSVIELKIQKFQKVSPGIDSDKENIGTTKHVAKKQRTSPRKVLKISDAQTAKWSPNNSPLHSERSLVNLDSGSESERSLSKANENEKVVEIVYFVYASRLLFEMVADPAIHILMQHVIPVVPITSPARPSPSLGQPVIFQSKPPRRKPAGYEFTLAGVMKAAESTGYAFRDNVPKGIKTQLFEYQRSSLQWMLDHERDEVGLNGYFWEERKWADDGAFYYFPLAGEFRLSKPPLTTGGLLCEEMGLGKTLEVLSLILANPRKTYKSSVNSSLASPLYQWESWTKGSYDQNVSSRASLIVVPLSLIGQWYDETLKHVEKGKLQVLTLADLPYSLPLSSLSFHPAQNVHLNTHSSRQKHRYYAEVHLPLCTRALKVLVTRIDLETKTCEVRYLFENLWDWDIVLTTYDVMNRGDASGTPVRSKINAIHWHRCILDECQEVKTPTAKIAKQVSNIRANHRWMVSGTPLHSSILDLHGELNFLNIWPFSLRNDGFWERKVQDPFDKKNKNGLGLLRALIDICMIRHSKSQAYVDGSPLVQLPKRIIEWVGVDFGCGLCEDSDAYIYWFIEKVFAEEVTKLEARAEASDVPLPKKAAQQLRALFLSLQRAATDPSTLTLSRVDNLVRRIMGANVLDHNLNLAKEEILALSPDDALRVLQLGGAGRAGGLNRDTGRSWAMVSKKEEEKKAEYEELNVKELKKKLEEIGLPIPKVWGKVSKISAKMSLSKNSAIISGAKPFHARIEEEFRIGTRNEEHQVTVKSMDQTPAGTVVSFHNKWAGKYTEDALDVFRWIDSSRRPPYIELLIAHNKEKSGIKGGDVHEAGFATIYKLIAKTEVQCPICMCEVVKPTVTRCVHLFCQECVLLELKDKERQGATPKCPICRRNVSTADLIEVILQESEEEEQEEDEQEGAYELKEEEDDRKLTVEESLLESTMTKTQPEEQKRSLHTSVKLPHLSDFAPSATQEMLDGCSKPHFIPGIGHAYPDPHLPALDPTFLWHIRSCKRRHSSKVTVLFNDVSRTLQKDPNSKFIVFSQYPDVVKRLAEYFQEEGMGSELICGGVSRESRQSAVSNFQNDPNCKVILLTTGSAAAGLTLTAASTLYMMEPCTSTLHEAQALSRAHRIGARENVRCVIFYMTGTVDERLLMLRQSQGSLVDLEEDSDALGVQAQDSSAEGGNPVTAGFNFEQLKVLVGMQPPH